MAVPRITSRRRQPTTRGGGLISQKLPGGGLFGPTPKKFAPAPAAPVSSVGSSAASIGGVSAPAAPDPRDAQYFNDVAKLEQYYATRKADLQAATDQDTRDLATSNQALNEQRPKDDLSAKQNANKAGLFYSGFLGKNLGEIETSYAKRRADLQTKFQDNANARARQLSDLDANYGANGLNRNDILLAANARQTERDLANPPADPIPLNTPASAGAGNYAAIAARQKKFRIRPLQPGSWYHSRGLL